ncbi:hypothetical protein B6J19_16445 [Klebsiella quasipneumoniae]|nr:hypothetical protein [Klebsiella quasipneumoniae]HCB1266019.1 hypothetical protein [Klebsiella quasipneumoniae subsp. quasipneumoniae]MBM5555039.1 hypothetical protein [Klebsiella quasipneumoniae]MBM5560421.1 hypothetical protein [Klebsiella quasipneumoniae]PLG89338.1 hypothetical protein B6J19_16445 [Klebsiella quasipneumoniae]
MGVSSNDCGQACFDNRDSAELIRLILWILAIITGIFAFMDNGSQKKILSNNIKSIDIFADFIISASASPGALINTPSPPLLIS